MFTTNLYKICILGDGAVGKTTLLNRYVGGKFIDNTKITIGTDFYIKNVLIDEFKTEIKLQLWDLSGQTHFSEVRPSFYHGAKGIIYVFDLTRLDTLKNLIKWKEEMYKVLNEKKPSILIGNKLDLIKDGGSINHEDIEELSGKIDFIKYFETSAKDEIGIEKAFEKLAREIFKTYQNE